MTSRVTRAGGGAVLVLGDVAQPEQAGCAPSEAVGRSEIAAAVAFLAPPGLNRGYAGPQISYGHELRSADLFSEDATQCRPAARGGRGPSRR
jgi:hypothetical protein